MDACMQLAIEGEKLMDGRRWSDAARFYEAAIVQGTDDVNVLNVIYHKLWVIYHNIGTYEKALKYAHYQLELARHLNDFEKEAFSSARIGISLSMMNSFEDACSMFQELLRKAEKKQHDAFIEIALYHLGQTEFKRAKHMEVMEETTKAEVDIHLHQAVSYFLRYKAIVGVAKDAPLVGKVSGTLSHVYFKLGHLEEALSCQLECLQTSLEFGDQVIQQSSKSFLGFIYCSMKNYMEAADSFQEAFYLAEQLNDTAKKAKALYSLANVMHLLEDDEAAIDLSLKYLDLVRSIGDDVGESHMYCFMCQQYRLMGELQKSLHYAQLYQSLTQKLRDVIGYKLAGELCVEISDAIAYEANCIENIQQQTNNDFDLDDSVDEFDTKGTTVNGVDGGGESENKGGGYFDHCSTMLGNKTQPVSASNIFSSANFTEHCEVNITDLDVSIKSEVPHATREERNTISNGTQCHSQSQNGAKKQILPKCSHSDSHITANSREAYNGINGHTQYKQSVQRNIMKDKTNIAAKPQQNGFHHSEVDPKFEMKNEVDVQPRTPVKEVQGPLFFRSPQIKRASRAGSEFEFDPFVLAARRKAGGSKNGSKQPPFRAEECESLYDLITKAQSVGRIDEQRVSLDRLNSKASVTSEVGAETKSHMQLRATKSYDLTPSTSKTAASKKEPSALSSPVPCSSSSLMMSPEQLIDQIAKHQSYRMNDQRSEVNLLPGLTPSPRNQQVLDFTRGQQLSSFLDILERCQDNRFDDQRTVLPPLPESETLPENEFLNTIQRIQISGRMDEQRTSLPPRRNPTLNGHASTSQIPPQVIRHNGHSHTNRGIGISTNGVHASSSETNGGRIASNENATQSASNLGRPNPIQGTNGISNGSSSTSIFRRFRPGSRKGNSSAK